MADKIFFKTGLASSLPTTKTTGQLLFAIDGTTGSIYLDKDSNTRIKFNADAVKLVTPRTINGTYFDGTGNITTTSWGTERTLSISSTAGATGTKIDGSADKSLVIPNVITGFNSITATTFIGNLNGKATSAGTADNATTASSCTGNANTATSLATPRNLAISSTASNSIAAFDGKSNTTLYVPTAIEDFSSIESDKYVVNDKVTLQYNATNECLEFIFG